MVCDPHVSLGARTPRPPRTTDGASGHGKKACQRRQGEALSSPHEGDSQEEGAMEHRQVDRDGVGTGNNGGAGPRVWPQGHAGLR
jgi:hypothetical protein